MKRTLARVALMLVATLVALLLAEGAARLADMRPPAHQLRAVYGVQNKKDVFLQQWGTDVLMKKSPEGPLREVRGEFLAGIRFKLCYDVSAGHRRPFMDEAGCVVIDINDEHLRGPLVPVPKPADTYRIAAVGDSFTFGDGVPYEVTWVHQLQQLVQARIDGTRDPPAVPAGTTGGPTRVDSVNLGVPGYTIKDVHTYLKYKGLAYDPDLVVYGLFLNDFFFQGTGEDRQLGAVYQAANGPPEGLASVSVLYDMYRRGAAKTQLSAMTAQQYFDAYDEQGEAWETGRRYLRKMVEAVDEWRVMTKRDIDFVVVIFPVLVNLDGDYPYAGLHEQLHGLLDEFGVRYVDLLPAYRGQDTPSLWVHPTDHHPNEIGHGLAAWAIDEALADLLPPRD